MVCKNVQINRKDVSREVYELIFKHTAQKYRDDCEHMCLDCKEKACVISIAQLIGFLPHNYSPEHE